VSDAATKAVIEDYEEPSTKSDPLPAFPRCTGSLMELAESLCPSLPWEFKFMAGLTIVGEELAGRLVYPDEPHIEPRFYNASVALAGRGKSGSNNEVWQRIRPFLRETSMQMSIDSGPAFVMALCKNPRILIMPDEITDLFDKSKKHGEGSNSLMGELLKLYEHHTTQNTAKRNIELKGANGQLSMRVDNARIAVLGGATFDSFKNMWMGTGGQSNGLQDRVVITTTCAGKVPAMQLPSNETSVEAALMQLARQIKGRNQATFEETEEAAPDDQIQLMRDPAIFKRFEDWWEDMQDREPDVSKRMPAMVSRFLAVLALTNDERNISAALLDQALAWGDYQTEIKKRLMPTDAYTIHQEAEHTIIRVFMDRAKESAFMGMTYRECRRYANGDRVKGGIKVFGDAFVGLVRNGVLVRVGKTGGNRKSDLYLHEDTVINRERTRRIHAALEE
jgi:Protein of unknown function (DUF3987)